MSQGLSSEDDLVQLYLLVASNIEGWVDVSQKVCKILVCNGMLLQNVNHLLHVATLPQIDTSEVSVKYNMDKSRTMLKFHQCTDLCFSIFLPLRMQLHPYIFFYVLSTINRAMARYLVHTCIRGHLKISLLQNNLFLTLRERLCCVM